MSEPKLISPLLDNFMIGDPISDHNGIKCCPAMDTITGNKYIIKIISVPSSPSRIDALLLTGAIQSREEAQQYFEDRTKALVQEIEILQSLARQEGYLPYNGYQVVPMEDSVGYDIYIMTPYRRSLLRQFTKQPLTQLDAVNLGLDICSALTACRRSGYVFINLKPSNIYISENGEYKISDLGFLNLNALKYASIPDHYIGDYTAPEIADAFSSPNETMDVYALGRILYEIFNGGSLPDRMTASIDAPAYADDELAQIILKACDPNPENRWEDPVQMGQMLISYMQKNGVSHAPIVPSVPENQEDGINAEEIDLSSVEEAEKIQEIPSETEEILAEVDNLIAQEETTEDTHITDDSIAADVVDETTDEIADILTQADMLAALEVPQPVVAPEPVEIVLPKEEPIISDNEDNETISETEESISENQFIETEQEENMAQTPKKKSNWLRATLIILLFLSLIAGGFFFFKYYVIKTVDNLEIVGSKDDLTVKITSQIDDALLTVSCQDNFGKIITLPVTDDTVQFSDLLPNTDYTITVNITGFHILTGKTTGNYFTPLKTTVTDCKVEIGETAGSAILTFGVSGPDSKKWNFTYSAPGQQEKTVIFEDHKLILNGLKEQEIYTGYLTPVDDLFIDEAQPIIFTANKLVQASNVQIVSCTAGKLLVKWQAPDSVSVGSWTVRCHNETTFDETVTTKNTYYEFSVPDCSDSYTVEVKAEGQKAYQTDKIGKNTVTVTSISADVSLDGEITLTWESQSTPEKGWLITYGVNGSEMNHTITSNENSVKLSPVAPSAKYTFAVYSADSVETLVEAVSCNTANAVDLLMTIGEKEYAKKNFQFSLCTRPETGNWTHQDPAVTNTQSFSVGQFAGFVLFLDQKAVDSEDEIIFGFIILDENGYLVSAETAALTWNTMWDNSYCYLNIPSMPQEAGYYTISVLINSQQAFQQAFVME